jgi:diguanylate cyclase (GGDEF)-like protein/PAS domain S-box-containing protein
MDVREGSHIHRSVEPESRVARQTAASALAGQERLDFHTSVLDAICDGVLAHTLDGQVLYVNKAACQLYGFSRSDFERLGPWGWVPEHARSLVPARVADIKHPGGTVFASSGPPREDGSPLHTEVHAQLCNTFLYGEIVVSVVHDTTERVLSEERIRHMALHDTLTGLPNRSLLEERMLQALASADRHGDIVGVVYADLDDFKPINDALGHATGDEVLRIVAERMKSCMRESDTVARVGGDEFVALFSRLGSANDLATVAASIVDCVDVPIQVCGHQVTVTASVGLALYSQGEATDELINRADHAMYRAKQDGLSGWEEYLAELRAASTSDDWEPSPPRLRLPRVH